MFGFRRRAAASPRTGRCARHQGRTPTTVDRHERRAAADRHLRDTAGVLLPGRPIGARGQSGPVRATNRGVQPVEAPRAVRGAHGGVRARCRSVVRGTRTRSEHTTWERDEAPEPYVELPVRAMPPRAAVLVLHGGKADSLRSGRSRTSSPSAACSRSCAPSPRWATTSPSGSCATATGAGTTPPRTRWPTCEFALDDDRRALRPGARRARRPLDGRSRRAARRRPPVGPRRRGPRALAPRRRAGRAARRPRPRRAARHPRPHHQPARVGPVRRPRRARRPARGVPAVPCSGHGMLRARRSGTG